MIWFALVLWGVADVPPPIAVQVYAEALAHDVNPLDLAALLVSENAGSRRYRSRKTGAIGERGVFQIHPPSWARRCGVTRAQLYERRHNVRCAAWVVADIQRRRKARVVSWEAVRGDPRALARAVEITPRGRPDWRAHWRCSSEHLTSPGCRQAVAVVKRHQIRLNRAWSDRGARTLWPIVSRLGALAARSYLVE